MFKEKEADIDKVFELDLSSLKMDCLGEYIDYVTMINKRVLYLWEEVNSDVAAYVIKRLMFMTSKSNEPIRLIINSIGGDVYCSLMVYDSIINLTNKGIEIICEGCGLVASGAALILQAGSKRVATKHTRIMIHEITSLTVGKTSEQEEQVKEIKKLNDMLNEILAERTGKTVNEITTLCKKKDVWFSVEEAKKFGLIDEII